MFLMCIVLFKVTPRSHPRAVAPTAVSSPHTRGNVPKSLVCCSRCLPAGSACSVLHRTAVALRLQADPCRRRDAGHVQKKPVR